MKLRLASSLRGSNQEKGSEEKIDTADGENQGEKLPEKTVVSTILPPRYALNKFAHLTYSTSCKSSLHRQPSPPFTT